MRQIFKKSLIAMLPFLILGVFTFPAHAQPAISSKYACLMDAASGQVIWAKHMDEKRPVASTTKMMTAILTIEYCDLHEKTIISRYTDRTPEFTVGLKAGQEAVIEDLLKVSMLRSANDAAVALAEHIAGDERLFGHLMSKKAFAIGAVNTHFVNSSGLPDNDHYSSAYDLAVIGRYLLANPYLQELVSQKQSEYKHPGYLKPLTINNTNSLLQIYTGADGIKTGTTNAAGKCLVASATRNKRQLIAVALKSGDRSGDCVRMFNYGFSDVLREKVLDHGICFKELKLYQGVSPYLKLYPESDVYIWKGENSPNLEKRVELDYSVEAPVRKGQIIGCVELYAEGKQVTTVKLLSAEDIDREPALLLRLIRDFVFRRNNSSS